MQETGHGVLYLHRRIEHLFHWRGALIGDPTTNPLTPEHAHCLFQYVINSICTEELVPLIGDPITNPLTPECLFQSAQEN